MAEVEITPVQAPPPHLPETFRAREVTRLADRGDHQDGMNVFNFLGDVAEMLKDGTFYALNERDFTFLGHLLRCCIRPADNPEGAVVSLSDRQWGRFVGIRRTYLTARRNPSNLCAMLRAQHRVATPSQTFETETTTP